MSICPSCSNNPTKSCVIRKQELRTPAQIAEKAKKHGFKTRNDFIRAGVEFYLQWLERGDSETFLTPALEQVITAKLRDSENRISRMMFKLAVEQNFLAHLLASTTELEDYQVKKLYQDAIDEVRATNGNLSVTDVFRN